MKAEKQEQEICFRFTNWYSLRTKTIPASKEESLFGFRIFGGLKTLPLPWRLIFMHSCVPKIAVFFNFPLSSSWIIKERLYFSKFTITYERIL